MNDEICAAHEDLGRAKERNEILLMLAGKLNGMKSPQWEAVYELFELITDRALPSTTIVPASATVRVPADELVCDGRR